MENEIIDFTNTAFWVTQGEIGIVIASLILIYKKYIKEKLIN